VEYTGTAADLTAPPVTGAPAQASSKATAPVDSASDSKTANALAARRESVTVADQATKSEVKKAAAAEEDGVKLREFVEDDGHFSLVRNFRLADVVTLGNGFCGALSLFSAAQYMITHDEKFLWRALSYPVAGFIFDALDGKVARWRQESSMLGQELDSLADSISFGVAPAFTAFALGLRTPLDQLALLVFICSGIARLARFNATVALVPKDKTGKSKYFEGLPIPSSLLMVAGMAICVTRNRFEGPHGQGQGLPWGLIEPLKNALGLELHWVALVPLGWAAAMISKTLRCVLGVSLFGITPTDG
jgi:CDP-diacylglycerol--serine O-phosphatidyltransferase